VLQVVLDPLAYSTLDGWRESVLRELMPLLGADKSCFLMPVSGKPSFYTINTRNISDDEKTAYPATIQPLDREVTVWERQARLGAFNRASLWHGQERTLLASPYYNEFVVPKRLFDATGLTARLNGPASATTAATLWFHHDRDGGPTFGHRGIAILRLLTPAIGAAVRSLMQFAEFKSSLARTVDALGVAAAVYETDGRLIHETTALMRLLASEPERALVLGTAREAARSLVPAPELRTARGRYRIEAILSGNRLAGVGSHVIVTVTPLNAVSTTVAAGHPRAALGRPLGLTMREQEVARLIGDGCGIAEITAMLGVSRHTVRHHVERVFAKLDVHTLAAACARIRSLMHENDSSSMH
jgi:DNA-binding CsgD family transcriptional regulator